MKPTAAEIENGMSRSHKATMPPTQPNGTPVKRSGVRIGEVKDLRLEHEARIRRDHRRI